MARGRGSFLTFIASLKIVATSKRILSLVVRGLTVVLALGFLTFYVWRAASSRRQEAMMFASSKNARALSLAADQYFLEAGASAGGPVPTSTPVPARVSDPFEARSEMEEPAGFVRPSRSLVMSGSKSMSGPLVAPLVVFPRSGDPSSAVVDRPAGHWRLWFSLWFPPEIGGGASAWRVEPGKGESVAESPPAIVEPSASASAP